MKKVIGLLFTGLLLSGCASIDNNKCPEAMSAAKAYIPTTEVSKEELRKDLRSGKIGIDTTLDYIKSHYGDPDDILVVGCTTRIIYRPDRGKGITLWFDDGRRLSMWSD